MALLARACLDVQLSARAQWLLNDLGRGDAVPAAAEEPGFKAQAEFAVWLTHPCELGRPADELEIVDHRTLYWPPDGRDLPFWLIRYRLHGPVDEYLDPVGIGLVGSLTFCFFSYDLVDRLPEDAYATHCYWECCHEDLIIENSVDADSGEYDSLLPQYTGGDCQLVRIVEVAELSSELNYPQPLVALASATRHGQASWLVLDGPRSRRYSAAEMRAEQSGSIVLMLHVGRRLLGFTGEPGTRTTDQVKSN